MRERKTLSISYMQKRHFNKKRRGKRGKVDALGVLFWTSEINESNINFREKIEKITSSWSARNLTLPGKIAILKSLVVSQIVYLLSSSPSPPGVMKEINCLWYDFLWDSKGDKIKRTEMINEYNKGGLKMIDLQSFNESLKIKWIKGYLDDNNKGKWKSFVNHYLEKHGGKLVFSANLKRQDTPLLNISDPFLAETVEYWSTLNYSEDNLNFPSSQIWLNSLIRIDNKPFFYKSWFWVKDVKDLLDDSNYNFLSYSAFITKHNIETNYLEYYKVVSALKHFKKKCSNRSKLHYLGKSHWQPVLFRESLQNVLSDFAQKKDFLTSEKPGKVACWRSFFKCTSELGKYLSATFSMYYENEGYFNSNFCVEE